MQGRLFLTAVLFSARVFQAEAQQPWHDPNRLSSNQEFLRFAEACQVDSSWSEAYVLVQEQGAIKQILAERDPSSGKILFHSGGDMRWVVGEDRLDSNLSVSLVEGYNGGSESMVWGDQLHSLGGYGLWRKHFELLRFEGGQSAWQLLGVLGDKPLDRDIDRSMMHARNGLYYVLEEVLEQAQYGNAEFMLHELNVATRTWSLKGVVDPRLGSLNGGTGMGSHWILRNFAGELIVIDLDDMMARVLPNGARELSSFLEWNLSPGRSTFIHSDSAWHVFQGERKTYFLPLSDLEKATEFGVVDPHKPIHAESEVSSNGSAVAQGLPKDPRPWLKWLPWGLVAWLSLVLLRTRARGTNSPSIAKKGEAESVSSRISPITTKVMTREGAHLETEELDELLGIAHLSSPETLRSQRARTINRINTEYRVLHGTDLILRKQSQEDRRRSIYVIHTSS